MKIIFVLFAKAPKYYSEKPPLRKRVMNYNVRLLTSLFSSIEALNLNHKFVFFQDAAIESQHLL